MLDPPPNDKADEVWSKLTDGQTPESDEIDVGIRAKLYEALPMRVKRVDGSTKNGLLLRRRRRSHEALKDANFFATPRKIVAQMRRELLQRLQLHGKKCPRPKGIVR